MIWLKVGGLAAAIWLLMEVRRRRAIREYSQRRITDARKLRGSIERW